MTRFAKFILGWAALIVLLALTGCGGSAPTVTPVEASTSTVDSVNSDSAASDPADDDVEADQEPAATKVPEPTATPVPEPTATAEPDPTAEPEPELETAAPTADDDSTAALDQAGLPPETLACVLKDLADDAELLGRINDAGGSGEELSFDDQVTLMESSLECDPEAFAELARESVGADSDIPPEFVDCMALEMSDSPTVAVALAALGNEMPVPEPAQEPAIGALTKCFDAKLFLTAMVADDEDPLMQELLDVDCMIARLDEEDTMRQLWTEAVVGGLDSSLNGVEEALGLQMLSCMSFGKLIASQAAADGFDLSDTTIQCMDTEAVEQGLIESMAAGEDPADAQIGAIFLGCMSPEELEALAAS